MYPKTIIPSKTTVDRLHLIFFFSITLAPPHDKHDNSTIIMFRHTYLQ